MKDALGRWVWSMIFGVSGAAFGFLAIVWFVDAARYNAASSLLWGLLMAGCCGVSLAISFAFIAISTETDGGMQTTDGGRG